MGDSPLSLSTQCRHSTGAPSLRTSTHFITLDVHSCYERKEVCGSTLKYAGHTTEYCLWFEFDENPISGSEFLVASFDLINAPNGDSRESTGRF